MARSRGADPRARIPVAFRVRAGGGDARYPLAGGPQQDGAADAVGRRAADCGDRSGESGRYLIAIGLIGEPTAPVIGSGGAQKKKSYTLSDAQSCARSFR